MLIRVGNQRTSQIDLLLAGLLSLNAGALNAVGFLMAGSFTANMTGNISALADHMALGELHVALAFGGLVLAFIAGAGFAALAIRLGEARKMRQIYALAITVEALLLMLLSIWLLAYPESTRNLAVLVALSFVMGLQNAVTTMISDAKVRTTHVSGMATDIGIELSLMTGTEAERRKAAPKLLLHSLTLVSFAIGGIGGALVFALWGPWLFVMAALLLFAIALPEMLRARR